MARDIDRGRADQIRAMMRAGASRADLEQRFGETVTRSPEYRQVQQQQSRAQRSRRSWRTLDRDLQKQEQGDRDQRDPEHDDQDRRQQDRKPGQRDRDQSRDHDQEQRDPEQPAPAAGDRTTGVRPLTPAEREVADRAREQVHAAQEQHERDRDRDHDEDSDRDWGHSRDR